jgi:hypothetical protein
MQVFSEPLGRFGNTIFQYLAKVIFHIVYDAKLIDSIPYSEKDNIFYITDDIFIQWMKLYTDGDIIPIDYNKIYDFWGYFQHDTIYLNYKLRILDYIRTHPHDILVTDGKTDKRPDIAHPVEKYNSSALLAHPKGLQRKYDTVAHVRLEHFIDNGVVLHPNTLRQLLESIGSPSYCIVVGKISTEFELLYIEYLNKHFNIMIESNDVITDYHIMRQAKTLICSYSTLSWAAAFLSDTVQTVYMPNYKHIAPHQTFRTPIENTIFYENITCSAEELKVFLKTAV